MTSCLSQSIGEECGHDSIADVFKMRPIGSLAQGKKKRSGGEVEADVEIMQETARRVLNLQYS